MARKTSRGLPRIVEAVVAGLTLVTASPLMLVGALGILLTSPGPVLFRQQRIGRDGKPFELLKLRSMSVPKGDTEGAQVTGRGDARITPIGKFLRATKLDEIPQLWNVVRGDMALVGPRPEVPRFVDAEDPLWQQVLAVRPGLTDPVTLTLRDEESLISSHCGKNGDSSEIERFYRSELLPVKLRGYAGYLARQRWTTDLAVLFRTAWRIVRPDRTPVSNLAELERRLTDLSPTPRDHDEQD